MNPVTPGGSVRRHSCRLGQEDAPLAGGVESAVWLLQGQSGKGGAGGRVTCGLGNDFGMAWTVSHGEARNGFGLRSVT